MTGRDGARESVRSASTGRRGAAARRLGVAVPLMLLLASLAGAPPVRSEAAKEPGHQKPGGEPQNATLARMEEEVVKRINEIRTSKGLEALKAQPGLMRMARRHSADMALRGYFSHFSPEGGSLFDRLKEASLDYSWAGENIYEATDMPENQLCADAVDGWMKSPGHHENIVRPQYSETGVGVWRSGRTYTFTQDFRKPQQ